MLENPPHIRKFSFIAKVWLTSILLGAFLWFIYLLLPVTGTFDFSNITGKLGGIILISAIAAISSIPILLLVSVATYFISRTNYDVFTKKLVIAIFTTIFILAALYMFLDNNTQKRNFFPFRFKDFVFGLPYWLATMIGIMFFKLEKPGSPGN